jgi:hypothetical protein
MTPVMERSKTESTVVSAVIIVSCESIRYVSVGCFGQHTYSV